MPQTRRLEGGATAPMHGNTMDLVDQLRLWGMAHGAARDAERRSAADTGAQREAQQLRERADNLHREIYRSLDKPRGQRRTQH